MSQESYQAKKSAKAMIERLKEQHEKAQADEQADDGQTQEETTTEKQPGTVSDSGTGIHPGILRKV